MKKLKLNRESIRNLSNATLSKVAGGVPPKPTQAYNCTNVCTIIIDTDVQSGCRCPNPTVGCSSDCPLFTFGC